MAFLVGLIIGMVIGAVMFLCFISTALNKVGL